jgi:zinc transport system permease protein
MEFLEAVFHFEFLQHALMAGLLGGVAAGIVGTWVVVRRTSSIAGAVAHCVLAGLGLARWLQEVHGLSWADPMLGATAAALVAAALIAKASENGGEREDTVIAAIWALGMAIGLLFIASTPGYAEDLMSYLFGNILLVRTTDLWLMALLDVCIVVVAVGLHREIQALCFDEAFARMRGLAVGRLSLLLHTITALTVVLLVSIVGIVLVIALLTLPAAVAGRFSATLGRMMVLAIILSVAFTTLGLGISYTTDLPAGATTIVLAGLVYVIVRIVWRRQPG